MESHAVLLPAASLVYPAGVSVVAVVGEGRPGQAADGGGHQRHVGPPSHLQHGDEVGGGVGVGGSNDLAVLFELAVGPWNLARGWELAVHTEVLLCVVEAGVDLGTLRREPER